MSLEHIVKIAQTLEVSKSAPSNCTVFIANAFFTGTNVFQNFGQQQPQMPAQAENIPRAGENVQEMPKAQDQVQEAEEETIEEEIGAKIEEPKVPKKDKRKRKRKAKSVPLAPSTVHYPVGSGGFGYLSDVHTTYSTPPGEGTGKQSAPPKDNQENDPPGVGADQSASSKGTEKAETFKTKKGYA